YRLRRSVPALLVVHILVSDETALAVKLYSAALRAHVHLELARGAPPFPAVIAVAKTVELLRKSQVNALPRRRADIDQGRGRASELGECVHSFRSEEHGHGNEAVDDGHVFSFEADGEKEQKFNVAVEHADGEQKAEDAPETSIERHHTHGNVGCVADEEDDDGGYRGAQHRGGV